MRCKIKCVDCRVDEVWYDPEDGPRHEAALCDDCQHAKHLADAKEHLIDVSARLEESRHIERHLIRLEQDGVVSSTLVDYAMNVRGLLREFQGLAEEEVLLLGGSLD